MINTEFILTPKEREEALKVIESHAPEITKILDKIFPELISSKSNPLVSKIVKAQIIFALNNIVESYLNNKNKR